MGISIIISKVEKLDKHLWKATLQPNEVKSMTNEKVDTENVSLIILKEIISSTNGSIQFKPEAVRVLTVGNTDITYLIESSELIEKNVENLREHSVNHSNNQLNTADKEFINALKNSPKDVEILGLEFIKEVRNNFNGNLVEASKSKRFIESPDNFWTVKIQPRVKNLAITVRGQAETFKISKGLDLKNDRQGYSIFRISNINEIPLAINILRQVESRS